MRARTRTFFASKLKCWVRGIFEKPILGPHKKDRADLGKEGTQTLCMQINASTFSKCSIHVEELSVVPSNFLPKDHRRAWLLVLSKCTRRLLE